METISIYAIPIVYFSIGFFLTLLGIYLHSVAWEGTFKESLKGSRWIWLFGILLWPLGIDVLLVHRLNKGPNQSSK